MDLGKIALISILWKYSHSLVTILDRNLELDSLVMLLSCSMYHLHFRLNVFLVSYTDQCWTPILHHV